MQTPVAPSTPPASVPTELADKLIHWQRQHGRHQLPWQGTRDPYRVWLSEIMLQQTQVSTVLSYYDRFLARFPTVQALAGGSLDEVLALWSGLGYYSRARNLHRCAQTVMAQHGGAFPGTAEALETLPGVGKSTAAAIAAFCYGQRVAILDGNVKRVLTRVLAYDADLAESAAVARLWAMAEALLPQHGIERYTQGLMDLGAGVCSRTRPACERCPWQADCASHAQGRMTEFPVKTRRLKRGQRRSALLWLRQGSRQWLVQRPGQGVWAGLWCFPLWDDEGQLAACVAGWPGEGRPLPVVRHVLTHLDWDLVPLQWVLPESVSAQDTQPLLATLPTGRWVADEELASVGVPAPVRKLLALPG
jgi:A/G-specific adenine glycosylase